MIHLSEGEWKLMNALWLKGPLTITQLTGELKDETDWGKHTIITMLNRLEKKQAVRFEEGSRAKLYFPCVSREEAAAHETKGFLDKVYEGSLKLMVHSMVSERKISRQELSELYEILRKAEEDNQ